ncbi:spore maturation protein [Anaerocolumna aminovalerica]|jgi:spore maturation protein B|uniref:Spore maturation protein B n=1 Tax=Anaerocolumna aminovalerica TaxID=1527 RepID=A0A1I5I7J1_9FIRM|nr:nucleoside recognition domain-containing protein [Anaerocolumna aminovalerica]MBU5332749.1 spore maturation protein [Anaerocolumna aminovalerica]MDU6264857.1 nucleoside recognition domain-containing protein [Anaerocolumna aminovalerica]SFO56553.1 spore maturation protein B [Anaerocolumna aminovalerica]
MKFLLYISDYMIPFVLFYIVGFALLMKVQVFSEFTKGAEDGFKVVLNILPTLIGLMVAIGILRSSGTLNLLSGILKPVTQFLHFPSELVPLVTVKLFSSSAATSLVLDIFKEYGPDSYLGRLTSIIMSCTETVFYTMSIYFMTAGVKKTRYTLAGALFATFVGVLASTVITNLLF